MEKWIQERLSICLDFDVPDDMIKYIMSMKTSDELDEYFATLLNPEYSEHRLFMSDCKQRLFSKAIPNKKAANQSQPAKGKKQEKPLITPQTNEGSSGGGGGQKKKNKFVPLFSSDGKIPHTIMLKGRRPCVCEASQHRLINNCLGCGRIVCEQEGSGPCLFCGDLVCTNEELQLIKSSSKKGDNLKKSLEEKGGGEGLRKALEHRDRLLEYERSGEARTEVIDDESDYFQVNSVWHSEEERLRFEELEKEIHEKKHQSRSSRKIKMDIFGREVDDDPLPADYENQLRKQMTEQIARKEAKKLPEPSEDGTWDINSDMPVPSYVRVGPQTHKSSHGLEGMATTYNRVQDQELLEMQDMRHCLSMHQPYASLLVQGIKKHEGRVWYSNHRGRMWIASTAKEPDREEVAAVENFYKKLYNDDSIKFPSQYQTGCLLGCVIITDVLSQEEYREKYPDGESDSPYVFICANPQVLPVVFPIKGSHKIYQIDPKIHRAASVALLRSANKGE